MILLAVLLSLEPPPPPGGWPCESPLRVEELGGGRAGVECHQNPSLNFYYEVDARTGRVLRELRGYAFTRSPDGRRVAHAGQVPHFAAAPLKSFYLQVDGRTLYPKGGGPEERGIQLENGVHRNVLDLWSNLAWAPSGRAVACAVRAFDWRPEEPSSNVGEELNERFLLLTVTLAGKTRLHALSKPAGPLEVRWSGEDAVEVAGQDGRALLRAAARRR